MNKFELFSNDVTLYSYCLGQYLSNQSFELQLSEDGLKKAPQLEKHLRTPADCLAMVLAMSGAF